MSDKMKIKEIDNSPEVNPIYPCSFPYPSPFSMPLNFNTCGCGVNYHEKYNRECYFYDEEQDMGAHIPYCSYLHKLDSFNCDGCRYFRNRREIRKRIADMVEEEEKS